MEGFSLARGGLAGPARRLRQGRNDSWRRRWESGRSRSCTALGGWFSRKLPEGFRRPFHGCGPSGQPLRLFDPPLEFGQLCRARDAQLAAGRALPESGVRPPAVCAKPRRARPGQPGRYVAHSPEWAGSECSAVGPAGLRGGRYRCSPPACDSVVAIPRHRNRVPAGTLRTGSHPLRRPSGDGRSSPPRRCSEANCPNWSRVSSRTFWGRISASM